MHIFNHVNEGKYISVGDLLHDISALRDTTAMLSWKILKRHEIRWLPLENLKGEPRKKKKKKVQGNIVDPPNLNHVEHSGAFHVGCFTSVTLN